MEAPARDSQIVTVVRVDPSIPTVVNKTSCSPPWGEDNDVSIEQGTKFAYETYGARGLKKYELNDSPEERLQCYFNYLSAQARYGGEFTKLLRSLKNKRLGCSCLNSRTCHGHVWVKVYADDVWYRSLNPRKQWPGDYVSRIPEGRVCLRLAIWKKLGCELISEDAIVIEGRTDPRSGIGPCSEAEILKYHGDDEGAQLWTEAGRKIFDSVIDRRLQFKFLSGEPEIKKVILVPVNANKRSRTLSFDGPDPEKEDSEKENSEKEEEEDSEKEEEEDSEKEDSEKEEEEDSEKENSEEEDSEKEEEEDSEEEKEEEEDSEKEISRKLSGFSGGCFSDPDSDSWPGSGYYSPFTSRYSPYQISAEPASSTKQQQPLGPTASGVVSSPNNANKLLTNFVLCLGSGGDVPDQSLEADFTRGLPEADVVSEVVDPLTIINRILDSDLPQVKAEPNDGQQQLQENKTVSKAPVLEVLGTADPSLTTKGVVCSTNSSEEACVPTMGNTIEEKTDTTIPSDQPRPLSSSDSVPPLAPSVVDAVPVPGDFSEAVLCPISGPDPTNVASADGKAPSSETPQPAYSTVEVCVQSFSNNWENWAGRRPENDWESSNSLNNNWSSNNNNWSDLRGHVQVENDWRGHCNGGPGDPMDVDSRNNSNPENDWGSSNSLNNNWNNNNNWPGLSGHSQPGGVWSGSVGGRNNDWSHESNNWSHESNDWGKEEEEDGDFYDAGQSHTES